uniref:Uncharacterized protein n=1 Tax=Triticum urartu TaxID=4572 RepID=A0A8R7K3R9_TRIUA
MHLNVLFVSVQIPVHVNDPVDVPIGCDALCFSSDPFALLERLVSSLNIIYLATKLVYCFPSIPSPI